MLWEIIDGSLFSWFDERGLLINWNFSLWQLTEGLFYRNVIIFWWVFVAIFEPYAVFDCFTLLKYFRRKLSPVWMIFSIILWRIDTLTLSLWTNGLIWLKNFVKGFMTTVLITIRIVKIWLFGRTIVVRIWPRSVLILRNSVRTGSVCNRNKVLSIFVEKSDGFVLQQPIKLELEDFVIVLQLLRGFKLLVGLLQE